MHPPLLLPQISDLFWTTLLVAAVTLWLDFKFSPLYANQKIAKKKPLHQVTRTIHTFKCNSHSTSLKLFRYLNWARWSQTRVYIGPFLRSDAPLPHWAQESFSALVSGFLLTRQNWNFQCNGRDYYKQYKNYCIQWGGGISYPRCVHTFLKIFIRKCIIIFWSIWTVNHFRCFFIVVK